MLDTDANRKLTAAKGTETARPLYQTQVSHTFPGSNQSIFQTRGLVLLLTSDYSHSSVILEKACGPVCGQSLMTTHSIGSQITFLFAFSCIYLPFKLSILT